MKIHENFLLREVAGTPVVMPVGDAAERFNGMIKLNESGKAVFELLCGDELTEQELLTRLAQQYGTQVEQIKPAVLAFLGQLRQNGLLTE